MFYVQLVLTRLSSLLATMEANLCSPASSDMRKTYSGAVTWFDLWVLPVTEQTRAEGLVYFLTRTQFKTDHEG